MAEPELREWLSGRPMWVDGFDYERFTIPKRRGGTRSIEAPSDKLKALQRRAQLGKIDPAGQRRLEGLQAFLAMVEKQRSQPAPKQR